MAHLVAMGLASCTAPNPDFLPPASGCMAGLRACSGSRPVDCEPGDGGTHLVNAPCPSSGNCADINGMTGRCIPPNGAPRCDHEQVCLPMGSCMPFVDPSAGGIGTFCSGAEGVTPGGLPCSESSECRSDLCLHFDNAQIKRVCFLACAGDGDCTPPLKCRSLSVTVTGVQGTIQGCSPP